jgi:hypothetical protein
MYNMSYTPGPGKYNVEDVFNPFSHEIVYNKNDPTFYTI